MKVEKNISEEILDRIDKLNLSIDSYVAFDLDNTLLIGDIGDAVFAKLLNAGFVKDYSWNEYQNLLEKDREGAYKKLVQVMDGLELAKLIEITKDIIKSEDVYIEVEDQKIPIPKPNLIMQSVIDLLKQKGISSYVITASNQISAEIMCSEYFGLPSSQVIGIDVPVDAEGKIGFSESTVPYGEGKVEVLKAKFKNRPIITAGDSLSDKSLFDYTTPDGIILWLGREEEYTKLKETYYKDTNFFQIK